MAAWRLSDPPSKESYKIPIRLIVSEISSELKQAGEPDLEKLNKNKPCMLSGIVNAFKFYDVT